MKMDKIREEKEHAIDSLLVYLNDYIESRGEQIDCWEFSFSEADPETQEFITSCSWNYHKLAETLKICLSRGYLKHLCLGGGDFGSICLTEEGQGRAISVVNAKDSEMAPASISISQFTNNGNAQIGNNNIQNIENTFTYLIDQINKADVPVEQKTEAKNMLQKLIEHPLFNTILGTATGIIAAQLK
jgi:hypothetical protein